MLVCSDYPHAGKLLANLHRVKGKEKRPVKTGRLQFVLHLDKCLIFLCQCSLGGGQAGYWHAER